MFAFLTIPQNELSVYSTGRDANGKEISQATKGSGYGIVGTFSEDMVSYFGDVKGTTVLRVIEYSGANPVVGDKVIRDSISYMIQAVHPHVDIYGEIVGWSLLCKNGQIS